MVVFSMQNYTTQTPTPILDAFEPDMVITFDIRPEDDIEGNIDIWVDVQTPPVLPFGEFFSTMHAYVYVFHTVYSKIVDN